MKMQLNNINKYMNSFSSIWKAIEITKNITVSKSAFNHK